MTKYYKPGRNRSSRALLTGLQQICPAVVDVVIAPFSESSKRLTIVTPSIDTAQDFRKEWRALPVDSPLRRALENSDIVYRFQSPHA